MKQPYRLRAYAQLLRLSRPVGSFLLLWPTLWALLLAGNGYPSWRLVVVFVMGVFIMRSLGCVINDIADRHWDGFVTRTKNRPLVKGTVSLTEALFLLCGLIGVAGVLALQLNALTFKLAFLGLALAVIYPYTKRFTYWPQAVLGLAFSWGVPMAFAAQTQQVSCLAWCLFLSASLWPIAYDTLYAMVDREDDQRLGIKSTACFWGRFDRLFVAVVQLVFLLSLVVVGRLFSLSGYFYLSLCLAGALMLYQQYLIRDRLPSRCFKAFVNNTWVGAVVFMGIFLGLRG